MKLFTLNRLVILLGLGLLFALGPVYAQGNSCARFGYTETRHNLDGFWAFEHGSGGTDYLAIIGIKRKFGASVTEYKEPRTRRTRRITQTHLLCQGPNGPVLLGFDPTDKDTGARGDNLSYVADNFALTSRTNNGWSGTNFEYSTKKVWSSVAATYLSPWEGRNARPVRRCHRGAGLCYEIAGNWSANIQAEIQSFISPDKRMAVIIRTTDKALEDTAAMLAAVALTVDRPKVLSEPEKYMRDGMRAVRFSGEGYLGDKRVKWGFDIIAARKPTIILSLVDIKNRRASLGAYRAFFDSIRRV